MLLALTAAPGCFLFSERSVRHDPATRVTVDPRAGGNQGPLTPRQWVAMAQAQLARLLPPHRKAPMLSDELAGKDGRAADVVAAFEIRLGRLESLVWNFWGLAYSAQATMTRDAKERTPIWEGFEEVWVPIKDDLQLCARLGWARDAGGNVVDADCVVILPGIRGDNNVVRVRDLATALRRGGRHVLSVEVRGTGLTDKRYPKYEYTWGVMETDDLLLVADWLQKQPHVRRTGLVGYSWGANQCIHVAWAEGRPPEGGMSPRLRPHMSIAPRGPRRYEAGIIAISPLPRYEELLDVMEVEQSMVMRPVIFGLQKTVRDRMVARGYPNPSGSVRNLLHYTGIPYPEAWSDGLEYMRIMPYKGQPSFDRVSAIRVPLLILHAADDMVAPAQDVADLLATTSNPNVSAILLPTGGHIGFAPYAPVWYYNLILNFFDPAVGVAACAHPQAPAPPSDRK